MKSGRFAGMTIFTTFFMVSTAVYAQLPPSSEVLPAGFKVGAERNLGGTMVIEAKKPNENFPKPHMDQGIGLQITWMNQPVLDQMLEMMAMAPEEPAGQIPGSATREEPCGKQRYHNGVLSCRKVIIPWIGGGKGPDLVTLRVRWTGKGQSGLLSVEVNNFCGSKETAMGWIDGILSKITQSKGK
jgi:hypothetical protein